MFFTNYIGNYVIIILWFIFALLFWIQYGRQIPYYN